MNGRNAIAKKLRTLNFDVKSYNNLDRDAMHTAVDDFEAQLPNYDIALFYYAGHGFECNGNNLLMPTDTNGTDRGYRDWIILFRNPYKNAINAYKNNDNDTLNQELGFALHCLQDFSSHGNIDVNTWALASHV